MARSALLLLFCSMFGCKSDGTSGPSGSSATCDGAAEKLIELCAPFVGEEFRSLCELEDVPLVPQSEIECTASLTECTEESLDACDVRTTVITCSAAEPDCPAPFKCDVDNDECARCLSDDDCAPGRGCLAGNCYDPQYLPRDAGAL